jgi:RES domain-containing protein
MENLRITKQSEGRAIAMPPTNGARWNWIQPQPFIYLSYDRSTAIVGSAGMAMCRMREETR